MLPKVIAQGALGVRGLVAVPMSNEATSGNGAELHFIVKILLEPTSNEATKALVLNIIL